MSSQPLTRERREILAVLEEDYPGWLSTRHVTVRTGRDPWCQLAARKHLLKLMEAAGLVESRRHGRQLEWRRKK